MGQVGHVLLMSDLPGSGGQGEIMRDLYFVLDIGLIIIMKQWRGSVSIKLYTLSGWGAKLKQE